MLALRSCEQIPQKGHVGNAGFGALARGASRVSVRSARYRPHRSQALPGERAIVPRVPLRAILSLSWTTPVLLSIAAALCVGVATSKACRLFCAADRVCIDRGGFLALVLPGLGAYSLDAHIFGRRVIVLPADDLR
jgi:hypothetical protein